jgi:glucose-fructose oxidoreductase
MLQRRRNGKVRFAVVGLGHIAQAAVLPAFAQTKNAELTALVSGDDSKTTALKDRYGIHRTYPYDGFEECLRSGEVDAVYIAMPNDLHREYTVRAAHAGVHVLCEKPMAVTQDECSEMINACSDNDVKLMIAYRLHFEAANLEAVEIAQSGKLGDLRLFDSVFSMQVRPGNIRVQRAHGGGSVYDIGIYCINAARYIFADDPIEVFAWDGTNGDKRFKEVDEMTSVLLRFPHQRLATFTCSFNGPGVKRYTIHGTKGTLAVDPAYDYAEQLKHRITIDGRAEEKVFPKSDQFAAELTYFADCLLTGKDPEPDGWEGLADVGIIESIYKSAQSGQPVKLQAFQRNRNRPNRSQEIACPPTEEPEKLIGVEAPTLS